MNHVLVVKEDLQWQESLQETLPHNGFWVTGVKSVGDALTQVTDIAPDFIVLDIENPKLGAVEVCRQLKGHLISQAIPLVLCTPWNEAVNPEWVIAQGAQACIQKPFGTDQLVAVLNRLSSQVEAVQPPYILD
jgi:two-component system, chemotaxis family, response regulator PixH